MAKDRTLLFEAQATAKTSRFEAKAKLHQGHDIIFKDLEAKDKTLPIKAKTQAKTQVKT